MAILLKLLIHLEKILNNKGIKFLKSCKVDSIEPGKKSIKVKINTSSSEKFKTADNVLVAVGITGNIEGLGLEKLGIN